MRADTPKLIADLQDWYRRHCDEVWEHDYGVNITTTDNPGWWVRIDLVGTALDGKPFERIERRDADGEFELCCEIKDGQFSGFGDPESLGEVLAIFLEFAG